MISTAPVENEHEHVARAAWLHFVGGLTQAEVARRLGVPKTRAHRYIARAQSEGLVRVFVDVESIACTALESTLMQRYGLRLCRVAMDLPDTGALPLRTLSARGAEFFMQTLRSGRHRLIAVGHGRTLSASIDAMGRCKAGDTRFVCALGGLTRSFAANPFDVVHRLADKTGAESYLMPVPMYASSAEAREVLLAQPGVDTARNLVRQASLLVVGIGAPADDAYAAPGGLRALAGEAPIRQIDNACAELLGRFFNIDGERVHTELDHRVTAPDPAEFAGREVVAIAGGDCKRTAIEAALNTGLLSGLITDESTARAIVEQPVAPPLDGQGR